MSDEFKSLVTGNESRATSHGPPRAINYSLFKAHSVFWLLDVHEKEHTRGNTQTVLLANTCKSSILNIKRG